MITTNKPPIRKRTVTGWRHVERRKAEIRARHRPVLPLVKREA
jgi:hypothetical protein